MWAEGGTTFTGPVRVNGAVAARGIPSTDGYVDLQPGGSATSGFVEWFKSGTTPTRIGYMGFDNTNLTLVAENGANFTMTANATVTGNLSVVGTVTSGGAPVPVADESLRMVRGRVSATGTVLLGSGFSVIRMGTGYYRIALNRSFSGEFVATVTGNAMAPVITPGAPIIASISKTYTDGFDVDIFLGATRANAAFDFILMGPR
jgi:hypothetical protein